MSVIRRFLLASSLARLIEREKGGQCIREGYFPEQSGRSTYVHLEGETGRLVLVNNELGRPVEECTELSRAHAEALLNATLGKIDYLRIDLSVGTHDVSIRRLIIPDPLDLIVVEFGQEEQAQNFWPLPWFGPEITAEPGYHNRSMALAGLPSVPDIEFTGAVVDSLLDTLEHRFSSWQVPHHAAAPEEAVPHQAVASGQSEALVANGLEQDPSQTESLPVAGTRQNEPEDDSRRVTEPAHGFVELSVEDCILQELARVHPARFR